jgi:hypothetical protein
MPTITLRSGSVLHTANMPVATRDVLLRTMEADARPMDVGPHNSGDEDAAGRTRPRRIKTPEKLALMALAADLCHAELYPRGKGKFYKKLESIARHRIRPISVNCITKFIDQEMKARDMEVAENNTVRDGPFFKHLDVVRERMAWCKELEIANKGKRRNKLPVQPPNVQPLNVQPPNMLPPNIQRMQRAKENLILPYSRRQPEYAISQSISLLAQATKNSARVLVGAIDSRSGASLATKIRECVKEIQVETAQRSEVFRQKAEEQEKALQQEAEKRIRRVDEIIALMTQMREESGSAGKIREYVEKMKAESVQRSEVLRQGVEEQEKRAEEHKRMLDQILALSRQLPGGSGSARKTREFVQKMQAENAQRSEEFRQEAEEQERLAEEQKRLLDEILALVRQ